MDLFLIAHVAGRPVAIDGAQVDSVVDLGEIVPVPGAERAVRGLAALRSRVVTVIDTGVALGKSPMPADSRRAVITRIDGHHYALLVDALEDVEREGEPVLALDLARLVPGAAMSEVLAA
jgi:purine-binding chemotaxis protein CheW